jgi:uncharacterized protein YjiS (DUF1127 family)
MFQYNAHPHLPTPPTLRGVIAQFGVRFRVAVAARLPRWVRSLVRSWVNSRRIATAMPRDFRMLSGRELHDIGLTRTDVPCVGWDALTDFRTRI